MTSNTDTSGSRPKKRYRMPGIEREGIAQLSLLETALWPLQGGLLKTPRFETSYSYITSSGKHDATVTVRSAMGLQSSDEYFLWGLLGLTLERSQPDAVLLAKPAWILRQLGMAIGGTQYTELRNSLVRLSTTSYQNTGFFNPETHEHEYVVFQFMSILLPTVKGLGEIVDNDRLWRIEWNPAFFRFCTATAGNLLFDLDLYRQFSPAARRLFLKLQDRFWRSDRVFMNVDDLTINGLGYAATRPLKKRKFDLINCMKELLEHNVIELGRGHTDLQDLFIRHGKGVYVVRFFPGEYFRKPQSERTSRQKNAITQDALYDELRKIGVDDAIIHRLFRTASRGTIQRWVRITDAAMHDKPQGFAGFKKSPAAYLVDGVMHNRLPPDWMHAHEKRCEQQQWEVQHAAFKRDEQQLHQLYRQERSKAFDAYIHSPEGQQHYNHAYPVFLDTYKVTDPGRAAATAHEATLSRIEQVSFRFPEYAEWAIQQQSDGTNDDV